MKIINCKLLWNYINYLVACRYVCFVLIVYKLIYFGLLDFFISVLPYNIASCLKAFYVMACNADIHFRDRKIGIACIAIFQSCLYGFDRLVNVQHHSVLYTITVCTAKAKNLELAEFIFSACNGCNFCGANVEAYDDGLFAVHIIFVVLYASLFYKTVFKKALA